MERFGISSDSPETLQAIGRRKECSGERVRQVERQALVRARRLLLEQRLLHPRLATRGCAGAS